MILYKAVMWVLMLWGTNAFSQDIGAEYYDNGQYEDATKWYYEKNLAEGGEAGFLLYNLGNSAAKLEKTGLAVAAYMKSYTLVPRYEPALDNLIKVLGEDADLVLNSYEKSWGFSYLFSFLNFREWIQMSLMLSLLSGAFCILKRYRISFLFGAIAFGFIVISQIYNRSKPTWSAIKEAEDVAMYSGPGTFNGVISRVKPETPIQVLQEFNDWVQVRVWRSDTVEGWVPSPSIYRL